jgi:purine-binding chemotaxis protein CheW
MAGEGDNSMDINIVQVKGRLYGIPTVSVREVLDPVAITQLPFAPKDVDGLVNISGVVMVQIDLVTRLDLGEKLPTESGQLVIIDNGIEKNALHVEYVLKMVAIDDGELHQTEAIVQDEQQDLIDGEFQWQNKSVFLLAIDKLGLSTILPQESNEQQCGLIAKELQSDVQDTEKTTEDILQRYLIVSSGDESYALPLEQICFVDDLAELTLIPKAPDEVVGMIYCQNDPYVVIELSQLMANKKSGGRKLVVIRHQDFYCALSVDKLQGIRSLAIKDSHDVLTEESDISGYLLDNDQHLIGVLNFDALFSLQRMGTIQRFLTDRTKNTKQCEPVSFKSLLTFKVGMENRALYLDNVERIVEYRKVETLPEGGKSHLHGAVQIQGEVFPVIDLREQQAIQQSTNLTSYIVAGESGNRWALIVDQVNRVINVAESELEYTEAANNSQVAAICRINNSLVSVMNLESITQ